MTPWFELTEAGCSNLALRTPDASPAKKWESKKKNEKNFFFDFLGQKNQHFENFEAKRFFLKNADAPVRGVNVATQFSLVPGIPSRSPKGTPGRERILLINSKKMQSGGSGTVLGSMISVVFWV